jgi:hypothetical protein
MTCMTPEQKKALEAMVAQTKERGTIAQCIIGGWRFLLDNGNVKDMPGRHLSAQLYPVPRCSTESDWSFLGAATAILGAPQDSLVSSFETTHPNAVHHWHWDAPEDFLEVMRGFLNSDMHKKALRDMKNAQDEAGRELSTEELVQVGLESVKRS